MPEGPADIVRRLSSGFEVLYTSHFARFAYSEPANLSEETDLTDAYSVAATIDSGFFASYQSKDGPAWQHEYEDKRKQLVEKLSKVPASGLSASDARAIEVM